MLAVALVLSAIPIGVFSASAANTLTDSVITVKTTYAMAGSAVNVDLVIENNPGILGMTLQLQYDETIATLTAVEKGDALSAMTFTPPKDLKSGCKLPWDAEDVAAEDIKDGVIATLTFMVSETAQVDDFIDISVSYDSGAIIDKDMNPLVIKTISGYVQVLDYTPGDLNTDGVINTTDVVYLRRYIAGGYGVSINEAAADVNDDGVLNTTDVVLIRRYVADDCKTEPEGYNVTLKPSNPKCNHAMKATAEKKATCTEGGNIAYWYCTSCDKYFSDAAGKIEVTLADTVVEASGHTIVIDPAVEPTYETAGLTQGSHCSVCKKTIVSQEEIPPIPKDSYAITYIPDYGDAYLQTVNFNSQITENYLTYTTEDGLYELPLLEVEGYDFVGWFDGTSSSATKITKIAEGSKGNKTLYAKWELKKYTITFDCSFITVDSRPYYVNANTSLPSADIMAMTGYKWIGWSDENGVLYDSYYPAGIPGNVTLHANWQSYRNQAVPANNTDDFKVYMDEEAKTYNFTFDLGKIKNVPLYTICNYGKMTPGAPKTTKVETTSKVLGSKEAKNIAETVTKATTKTSAWTLSSDWNTISSMSESHAQELGYDTSTIHYDFSSTDSHISLSKDEGASTNETVNKGVNAKVYGKNTTEIGASASFPIKCVNVGVSAKNTTEIGGELSGHYDKTTVNDSYWNTSKSFDLSQSAMSSTTTSANMSNHVSNAYNYSTTSSQGGSESTSEMVEVAQSTAKEYATSVAYSTETIETVSYETECTTDVEGWWRQIQVGTVHVIGVVTYDITTGTYSAYTYNVLDDETTNYMDFSKTSDEYNDFETGVIPFEVPYSVNEYISNRIGYSNDLVVDIDTGMVTGFGGNTSHVHIPDYWTTKNADGTYTATKVVGIKEGVFANNTNIETVRLGSYITSIPDNAFSGCTSLKSVEYSTITAIGDYAFSGCTSLEKFVVNSNVTTLGTDAFSNVPEVVVYAANTSIVEKATASGAKSISIYLHTLSDELKDTILLIPDTVETFALYGRDNDANPVAYSNVRLESYAMTTIIDGINFVNCTAVPLKIGSENVTLSQVNIAQTPGLSMILTADSANLYLRGKNTFASSSTTALLSKNVTIAKAPETNITTLLTSTTGTWLYCGTITDNSSLYTGTKQEISADSYKQYINDALDWVLASEVPENATIVNEKWSYDLTTNITSNSSSVSGYTLYDSTWVWGNYGSWSSWSKNKVTSSDSRQVETKTVTDRAAYTNYKYYIYRTSDGWGYGTKNYYTGSSHGSCTKYDEINLSYTLPLYDSSLGLYGPYNSSMFSHSGDCYWFYSGSNYVAAVTHTEYRYRDRSKVYTYYHTKTEAMESSSEIAASDTISNVQKWVQYVVK